MLKTVAKKHHTIIIIIFKLSEKRSLYIVQSISVFHSSVCSRIVRKKGTEWQHIFSLLGNFTSFLHAGAMDSPVMRMINSN